MSASTVVAPSMDVQEQVAGDLATRNTEAQGAETEYSKAKLYKGEIDLQDFLLPDGHCIEVQGDAFDPACNRHVPVIDLTSANAAHLLVQAAENLGFFFVTHHNIADNVVSRLERHVRHFFELPMEAKMGARRGIDSCGGMCGFVAGSPMFLAGRWWAESLQLDWSEFRMRVVLGETLLSDAEFEAFRVDYYTYMKGLEELSHKVLSLLAEGLGLPRTVFTKQILKGDEQGTMRFNFYPACPRPDKVWGLIAHRDPSILTILHQDSVGGLQFHKNGQWIGVATMPNSFVVNIGDMLQVMSNGRFQSMLHRVVTNPTKPRFSMAYFCNTAANAVISVAPELVTEDLPVQYQPFSYAEYSCMPFHPSDFKSTHEYRPHRLDLYKTPPTNNVTQNEDIQECDGVSP